ncbi:MAG: cupin domain-containing protein [Candidatus Paceibacterota bacterium]|jgi:mannose-6-phosphate isomerase-like protein (cupin superfamily)
MENFQIKNIFDNISKGEMDQVAGIKITHLAGGEDLSFYLAEIESHKKINAHYHADGTEIYQIFEGSGEIRISKNENTNHWDIKKIVKKGDCFSVQEGEVHQLVNTGEEKLILLFACPKSHLSNDRTVVAIEN